MVKVRPPVQLDDEGVAKKEAVLSALMLITMDNFTEMKALNNPPQLVKDVVINVNELLYGIKGDYREARLQILCNPRAFIDKSHLLEDNLEGYHLDVLCKYRKLEIDP